MSEFGSALVSIIMAIVGVAIIAVLVSQSSNTSGVLSAGGTALSNVLKAAISPVSGSGLGTLATNLTGG